MAIISLQKLRIKSPRQQFAHLDGFGFAVQVGEGDRNIAAEFPDYLAADSAGRRQFFRIGDDRDLRDFPFAFRDGFPDRHAFGANRQTVARRFDVAARKNLAAFGFDGRSDLEIGIRRKGAFAHLFGQFD